MSLFIDRTVLITGASRGLGEAFALAMAERGCKLILCARSGDDLQRVAAGAAKVGKYKPDTIVADIGNADGVAAMTEAVAKLGRPVEILVNNAGFGSGGKFAEIDIERELAMIRLNIEACMRLARTYLPGMIERAAGGIINVASLGAFLPMPYMATYGATKAFLLSFSEALWAETRGTGVRVLALCPGPVPTNFGKAAGLPPSPDRRAEVDPSTCVETALRAYQDDRSFVVPGGVARLLSLGPRFLPRQAVARISAKSIGARFET